MLPPWLPEALASAESAADVHALAQAHNLLGLLASRAGDADRQWGTSRPAWRLAEEADDQAAQVAALNNLALAYRDSGASTRPSSTSGRHWTLHGAGGPAP